METSWRSMTTREGRRGLSSDSRRDHDRSQRRQHDPTHRAGTCRAVTRGYPRSTARSVDRGLRQLQRHPRQQRAYRRARAPLRASDQVEIGDYKLYLKAEGVEQVDDARTMPIERVEGNGSAIRPSRCRLSPCPRRSQRVGPVRHRRSPLPHRTRRILTWLPGGGLSAPRSHAVVEMDGLDGQKPREQQQAADRRPGGGREAVVETASYGKFVVAVVELRRQGI